MSSERTSEQVQDEVPTKINQGDYWAILDKQVQFLRHLNDELLRTLRLHILLGGGFLTALSIIVSLWGSNIFGLDRTTLSGILGWGFSAALVTAAAWAWFFRLGSIRLSYTNLRIGPPNQSSPATFELPNRNLGYYEALKLLFTEDIHVNMFNEQIERIDHNDISDIDVIEYNNRILTTREAYVNTVQQYLYFTFLLLVFGLIGVILL